MKDKLTQLMERLPQEFDCVVITGALNRRYYTGMRSSAGTLLATREKCYFIIDFRYIELAKRTVKNAEVILQDNLTEQLQQLVDKHGIKTIGIESSYMTLGEFISLRQMLPSCEVVMDTRVDELIMNQRKFKSHEEYLVMQQAQDLADRTFDYILGFISEGKTEVEIALELERYARMNGSETPAFATIAVAGVNSSLPHGVPGNYRLQNGDFFTLDFGVTIDGYVSDTTRTVAIGCCDDEKRRVYETVAKAQQASFDAIKVGGKCFDVDKAARDVIYGAGYEGCFGHGLGHSLGMQVHENPRFNQTSKDLIEPGLVMSVEPGIYLEGQFGCRIEDVVYITENGFINLTHAPKELLVIK